MVELRARRKKLMGTASSDEEADINAITTSSGADATAGSNLARLPSRNKEPRAALASSHSATGFATPSPQPRKSKRPVAKVKSPDQSNTRTLFSFFNKATQRQHDDSALAERVDSALANKEGRDEDVIQDDISDEETDGVANLEKRATPSFGAVTGQKRSFDGLDPHGLMYGSQKYLKRLDGTKDTAIRTEAEPDLRPWNDKYGPSELHELVVHKKKVSDVRQWLELSLSGHKHAKLLILKGAAGSGKTATLSMLSIALQFDIVEWRNPSSSDRLADNYVSMSAQFEDFLRSGSRFGGLEIVRANSSEAPPSTKQDHNESSTARHVLVIEEFPNNLTRATMALHSFRSAVLQYLEADAQRTTPLVMIISESVISDSNSSVDNFTAHRLLGPEIIHHPSATMIEFNRVAPTFITKALNLTLQKRLRDCINSYEPSEGALKKLSEFGDVRNAISTLEFLCTHSSDEVLANRPLKSKGKSRSAKKKSTASSRATEDAPIEEMSIISLRESSIGIFHAVGRVLYNKRTLPPTGSSAIYVPDHRHDLRRTSNSEVDLDSLIDETGTDVSTFLSSLHENYALSCFSLDGNSETTLESMINCLDSLADADILGSKSTTNSNFSAVTSDLKQSEISFQVGVRGLLLGLPFPVKRQALPGRSRADAHRMYYPTSLKLWKTREEAQELLEFFVRKALNGTLSAHGSLTQNSFRSEKSTGQRGTVCSQTSGLDVSIGERRSQSSNNVPQETVEDHKNAEPRIIVGSGHSARHELLLERLPYMKSIYSSKDGIAGSMIMKQIDQITQFTGVGMLQDEEEDAEETMPALRPGLFENQSTKSGNGRSDGFRSHANEKTRGNDDLAAVEKLVLSDDDIEDD